MIILLLWDELSLRKNQRFLIFPMRLVIILKQRYPGACLHSLGRRRNP
jgi:hypothetical protein